MSKKCVTAADFAAKRAEEEQRRLALEVVKNVKNRSFNFDDEVINDEGK